MLLQLPLSVLSPPGPRARLSILIFHRVLHSPDPLFPGEVDAERFDRICTWVKAMFEVLPFGQAVSRMADGSLPARAACITFDDGYADNRTIALPILQRHSLSAMFYVATGFLDGGRMWNDTVIEAVRRTAMMTLDLSPLGIEGLGRLDLSGVPQRRAAIDAILQRIKHRRPDERLVLANAIAECAQVALPDDLMMRSHQVRELSDGGMGIGAHTVSHPILATLSDEEAWREITESQRALQDIVGQRIGHFAYPNGKPVQDYSDASVRIVREAGFDSAVCTAWGAARTSTDRFQLPRFSPWDQTRTRFGLRMMRNLWSS